MNSARFPSGILALMACVALACGKPPQPPSFILVSLDTTRADHLGAYGSERDTTPFLDGLAERGFLFEQAIAPSENTLISHASLLTGLFPGAHGATHLDGGRALHASFETLAEDLAAQGYQTAAFLAHGGWLNERFGFDQGFATFSSEYRSAGPLLEQAAGWLAARSPNAPYFLFLHLFDVHSDWGRWPYEAPEPFRGRFASRDWQIEGMRGSDYLVAVSNGEIAISPAEIDLLRDQYDEGLAAADHQLRLFFESLSGQAAEDTWVVVVADHGEGFLEHGRLLHSSLHDEVVRIPFLLIPPPGSVFAELLPRRIRPQVRLVDVRPTVLSLAGFGPPAHCQGVDLVPCLRGRSACRSRPAPLYASGIRDQGFKLLRAPGGSRLYDLRQDPGETADLGGDAKMRDRLRSMESLLDELVARQQQLRAQILGGAEPLPVGEDPAAVERLRALGYVN